MSGLEFQQLRVRYEAALSEERTHDAAAMPGTARGFVSYEAEVENERLTSIRYLIESEMMDVPSPDAAAFAYKYLVAHGDNRDTDCWDAMLEKEARRFSVAPTNARGWDAALAEFKRLRAIELAIPERQSAAEELAHRDGDAATLAATTDAFDVMIAIPVDEGPRVAAKFRAIADFYDLGTCGIDRKVLDQVLTELDTAIGGAPA